MVRNEHDTCVPARVWMEAADVPLLSDLLAIHRRSDTEIWLDERMLAGNETNSALPSISSRRL